MLGSIIMFVLYVGFFGGLGSLIAWHLGIVPRESLFQQFVWMAVAAAACAMFNPVVAAFGWLFSVPLHYAVRMVVSLIIVFAISHARLYLTSRSG